MKAWHVVTYHQHFSQGRTRWALRPGQAVLFPTGELLLAAVHRHVEDGAQTLELSIYSCDGWSRIADCRFEFGGRAQLGQFSALHIGSHFDELGRVQLVEVLLTPAQAKVIEPCSHSSVI